MKFDIDELRKDEKVALKLMKEWGKGYEKSEALLSIALRDKDMAFNEYCAIEHGKNRYHEKMKALDEDYRKVWEEFEEFEFFINSRIKLLEFQIKSECAKMIECFNISDFAYKNRDKNEASRLRAAGYGHQKKMTKIREAKDVLEKRIRDAKEEAEERAPRAEVDYAKFEEAALMAKRYYEETLEACEKREKIRDSCKEKYDDAREVYDCIKKAIERAEKEAAE